MPLHHTHLVVFAALLIVVQVAMLFAWVRMSWARAHDLLTQYLNPVCWLTGFYGLWFILPQIVALFPTHHLLGFESLHPSDRLDLMLPAQLWVIAFLASVMTGYLALAPFLVFDTMQRAPTRRWLDLDGLGLTYVLLCFIGGIVAISLLGRELVSSEGMRSQLVKTPVGKLLTIAGFFGNFAFAFLFARLIVAKRFALALLVIGVFGTAVFLTGARGRLMWALVISTTFITLYNDRFNIRRFATLGVGLLAFLLVADAGLKAIRSGDSSAVAASFESTGPLAQLFLKRNFDGFSNFAFITHFDEVPRDPMILLNGGRDAFMNFYYAKIYESGVGFGVTYPGMFWLAGGPFALVAMGFLFGCLIATLSLSLTFMRDERLIWSYLFAMTWFCAIGGNFQESFDKLCTAAAPPLIWWLIDALLTYERAWRASREGVQYA